MLILKNLYFNIIILLTLSYKLNCKKELKYILLGSIIGAYRIFNIYFIFDFLMIYIIFNNKRAYLDFLIICILLKGVNFNLFLSPIVLYLYYKASYRIKKDVEVQIVTKEEFIKIRGFIDTGNLLEYFGKPIIILNSEKIKKFNIKFYVPFQGINGPGILPIIDIEYVKINNKRINKVLVGVTKMEGIELILNPKIMEE